MKIEILVEPLPQTRPRFSGGRCYEPARITMYKQAIGLAAKKAMLGSDIITEPVKVSIRLFRRYKIDSRRYGDLDNHLKAILDALNQIVWKDDAQVIFASVEKVQSKTEKVEIEIKEVK